MDFEFIHDFSTYETMSILGNASNSISKMILLEIGRTIQQQERAAKFAKPQNDVYDRGTKEPPLEARKETEHYDQRTELHPDRGLSVSQSVSAGDRGGYPDGQVRDAAQDVPEEAQADAVRPVVAGRQAGRISDGHRSASHRDGGSADAAAGTAERSGRGDEGQQPDGMGAGHEQLQGIGGGSGTPTVGLQLNESEQVHISPPEAENVSSTSSAFFVGQQDVDQFLRYGGNTDHLRMRVVSLFQIEMPLPMIAERLQMLYHGGNGITMEQGYMAAWYDVDGIHLALGDRARYVTTAQIIPWESAAQRVGQLLEAGQFASNVELLEAEGYERQLLSQSLLNLYHDIDMQNGIADSLRSLSQEFRNQNFPEEERRLDTCLANPDFRKALLAEYRTFLAAYQQDRSIMRHHYHDFRGLLHRLEELDLPRKTFTTAMTELPAIMPFITEDEIDEALSGGSGFSGGKKRIYSFFQEQHDPEENLSTPASFYKLRGISDEICRKNGLSVIQHPPKKSTRQYAEWRAEQKKCPTIRSLIREDIDVILSQARTLDEFWSLLSTRGYEIRLNEKRK